MEIDKNPNVGQKGRFYLTKSIWLPQEPIEKLNLKMSDMILRRMPKLPLGGDDALKIFPVLAELRKSHDKMKADLQYLLSHHEEIPALHEVHPRDLYVAGRAWRIQQAAGSFGTGLVELMQLADTLNPAPMARSRCPDSCRYA